METKETLGLLKLGLDDSLRAIPFDPGWRSDAGEESPTNGQRARDGHTIVALSYVLSDYRDEFETLYGDHVDLTQEPEIPLADLLKNIMHYCHREHVSFSEALVDAVSHFHAESGGAVV